MDRLETCHDSQSENKELRNHLQDLNAVRCQLEADRDTLSAEVNELHESLRETQLRWDAVSATMNQLKADTEHRLRDKDEETNAIWSVFHWYIRPSYLGCQVILLQ